MCSHIAIILKILLITPSSGTLYQFRGAEKWTGTCVHKHIHTLILCICRSWLTINLMLEYEVQRERKLEGKWGKQRQGGTTSTDRDNPHRDRLKPMPVLTTTALSGMVWISVFWSWDQTLTWSRSQSGWRRMQGKAKHFRPAYWSHWEMKLQISDVYELQKGCCFTFALQISH